MINLTHSDVVSLISYDENTGTFRWKNRPLRYFKSVANMTTWNKRFSGKVAGTLHKSESGKQYFAVVILKKRVLCHRLAWFYINGYWPNQIDHIDGNGKNNAIYNLRSCDQLENSKNQKLKKNNTSGICGVWFHNKNKNWCAELKVNRNKIRLGSFYDKSEAETAIKNARIAYGFHENHGADRGL